MLTSTCQHDWILMGPACSTHGQLPPRPALLRVLLESHPPLWPQRAQKRRLTPHWRPRAPKAKTPNQCLPQDQPCKEQMCSLQGKGQSRDQEPEATGKQTGALSSRDLSSSPAALQRNRLPREVVSSLAPERVKLQLLSHLSASYRNGFWHRMRPYGDEMR